MSEDLEEMNRRHEEGIISAEELEDYYNTIGEHFDRDKPTTSVEKPEDILMELLEAEDGNISPSHDPHKQDLHINIALAKLDKHYKSAQQLNSNIALSPTKSDGGES